MGKKYHKLCLLSNLNVLLLHFGNVQQISIEKQDIIQHGLITSILRDLISNAFGEMNDKIRQIVVKINCHPNKTSYKLVAKTYMGPLLFLFVFFSSSDDMDPCLRT